MASRNLNWQIATIVVFSFIAYLTIGMPLAVLPLEVSSRLGLGPLLAGLVISAQYVATFASRTHAGHRADTRGPKSAVCFGLAACTLSGLFLVLAASTSRPTLGVPALFISRFLLGCGESFVGTGAILWGIGRVGAEHTARTISWNGVATYAALAVGAPLGAFLDKQFGFSSLGWSVLALGASGWLLAQAKPPTPFKPGERLPTRQVFSKVLPYGMGLALGSIGFSSIATFITLFYDQRHWPDAAWSLTAFGTVFVGIRLFFASQIGARGGRAVALVCFIVEGGGLILLGRADTMTAAFLGAVLTGAGFSLIFPALAVEAMHSVREDNRGAALALYSVFIDLALAITGPVGGWLATHYPVASVFLFAAASSFAGWLVTWGAHRPKRPRPS